MSTRRFSVFLFSKTTDIKYHWNEKCIVEMYIETELYVERKILCMNRRKGEILSFPLQFNNTYTKKEILITNTIIWIIFIMTFWALKNESSCNCLCVKHIPTPHFNYYEMHISLYIIRANSNLLNVNRTGILL